MKNVFILKKMGNIEYLVIKKKNVEVFCNVSRGIYETLYFKDDCLSKEEIREYFIKDRGIEYSNEELHKLSLYDYKTNNKEKIFGDLYIVKYDSDIEECDRIIYGIDDNELYRVESDFFRNSKAVILDMKKVKENFERFNFFNKGSDMRNETI